MGFPRDDNEQTWITNKFGNMGITKLREDEEGDIYLYSVYYMVQTTVSIGYGDVGGVQTREYLFSIVILYLGFLGFAFIFGKIESAIKIFNDISLRQNKEVLIA